FLVTTTPLLGEKGESIGSVHIAHDITERKRSEEVLRKSEELYRSLFDNMLNGFAYCRMIYDQDRPQDFIYLAVNDAFTELTGLKDVVGKKVTEVIPGIREADPELFELYGRVAQSGNPERFETYVNALNMWFSISVYSLEKEHFVAVFDVITERKEAELELQKLAKQRQLALDAACMGWWHYDPITRISSWDEGYKKIFGVTGNQSPNENIFDRIHPKDLPGVWAKVEAALDPVNPLPYWAEYRINLLHGSMRWIEAHGIASFEGIGENRRATSFVGTVADITERKQAEEAQGRLASIVESADDAIIGKDLNGIIQTWNTGAEKVFGYKAEEVIGKSVSLLVPPGHVDEVPEILARIKNGEHIDNFETVRMRKDGMIIPVSLTFSAVKDAGGRIIGASKIAHDITEHKRAEEEIKRLNDDLLVRNEQLEFSNKELESFIYSVSHDLRGPLRHISGFADLVMKDIANKLDEKGKRYLSRIHDGAEKMSRLIDDLLNLSRISRQEIQRMEFNVSTVAESIIAELCEVYPGRSVEVDIKESITVFADRGLIEMVLSNLLGNSWKFTAKTEHARIEFGTTEQDGKIIYYVRDNGAGFDQKYAGKMFWPFHRLHSEEAFEGTGIGLAIVDRIIRLHGGKVWAEGMEGKGATIYFSLA
ncbi:MAG: PAS domain S-box protein, partial [Dissulfurispiraceae bacterium]